MSSDLFLSGGKDYLLVVDMYSGYPKVALLETTTSDVVIRHLKSVFARHGIQERLLTDIGPQYSSRKFRDFTYNWYTKHVTSSPRYPQSNGHAERAVQTIKNILKKAEDPY